MESQWNDKVFGVSGAGFDELALEVFRFQYTNNEIYRQYVDALGESPHEVRAVTAIPFLPIRFFKTHRVLTGQGEPRLVFESSGTTGANTSRHLVKDPDIYKKSFRRGFQLFYGDPGQYCIIGLLPAYLERQHSSLVYMVNDLIVQSGHPASGFYLDQHQKLYELLQVLEERKQQTLLIGVTFGLLDFAERFNLRLQHTIVMETGGMKGRRKEIVRAEVHDILKEALGIDVVHSEYGMTELLSQSYSKGEGIFACPPWMKVMLRDEEDPFSLLSETGKRVSGAINIIDLANIHSCSFIATDDAGRLYPDGRFEVLGRIDNSDLRGCSLMAV